MGYAEDIGSGLLRKYANDLSERYVGEIAENYDRERIHERKWLLEQECISGIVDSLAEGSSILDIPTGTGRFLEFYRRRNLAVTAADISADMLAESKKKAAAMGLAAQFEVTDARSTGFADRSFDTVLCIRLLNWVQTPVFRQIAAELNRVSRDRLVIGVRVLVDYSFFSALSRGEFLRYYRQSWLRIRRALFGHMRGGVPRIHQHSQAAIEDTFAALGLTTLSRTCIESARNGTDYFIYFLQKPAGK
jgi:ubiquinone/menaquinone biosynthesis C-methylase UbiE